MKKLGKPILLIALVLVVGLGALFGYSGLLQPYRDRQAAETMEEYVDGGAYDTPQGYEGCCTAVDRDGKEVTLTATVDLSGQPDRSFDDVKEGLLRDLQRQAQAEGLTLPENWEEGVFISPL